MPQLDVLIWFNLVFFTTLCFWGIYFLIVRLFLVNYQLILNLRLKFKNAFFNTVYVILVLLFHYNLQNISQLFNATNLWQKTNNTFNRGKQSYAQIFKFMASCLNLNILTSNLFIKIHYLYSVLNYNKSLEDFIEFKN